MLILAGYQRRANIKHDMKMRRKEYMKGIWKWVSIRSENTHVRPVKSNWGWNVMREAWCWAHWSKTRYILIFNEMVFGLWLNSMNTVNLKNTERTQITHLPAAAIEARILLSFCAWYSFPKTCSTIWWIPRQTSWYRSWLKSPLSDILSYIHLIRSWARGRLEMEDQCTVLRQLPRQQG